MADAVRKALHAYLSEEAHDAWHQFAEDNDVSLSAVLTAFGPALADQREITMGQKLESVVAQAHAMQRDKRRNRRQVVARRTPQKAGTDK